MPINNAFLRKLAYDELKETLFFATGDVPEREKYDEFTMVCAGEFWVQIETHRRIIVNGDRCGSVEEAKYVIQEMLHDGLCV